MTDSAFIQKELRQEIRERKITGYSAKRKINGSKSKRAMRMPSDYLTQKQLRERNGVIMSYNLGSPMDWKTFRAMPKDLQQTYIRGLSAKYHVTQVALCDMFEVAKGTMSAAIKSLGLQNLFLRGSKMSETDEENFLRFAIGEDPIHIKDEEPTDGEPMGEQQVEEARKHSRIMMMQEASFRFCGELNSQQIANTLMQCIPDDSVVEICVQYRIIGGVGGAI